MSKHQVWSDIDSMSVEELEDQYEIEISVSAGVVWEVFDLVDQKTFKDLNSWAEYIIAQESDSNYGGVSKIAGGWVYDDY